MPSFMNSTWTHLKEEFSGWRAAEVAWFLFCEISMISLSLWWKDDTAGIIAAAAGIAYTVFAGKGKTACCLFGMVNTPIYAFLAWKNAYYGDMALNIYYFAMMFPLFASWRRNPAAAGHGVKRTKLSGCDRIKWSAFCVLSILLTWLILEKLEGARPLCDAITNVLSVAALALTVKRCVEQWALWITVNLTETFMWFKVWKETGTSVSLLLMWILFLANGIYLWRIWLKDAKDQDHCNGRNGAIGNPHSMPSMAIE